MPMCGPSAANATGTLVYVIFTSSTVPSGIPQLVSPRPGADAWLVLFPTDEERWTGQSRHVRATRSSEQGAYRFGRLLAGDSFLAAVTEMEPGQEQDPEFLRGLRDRATRIAIADGAMHTQNLRVGQLPQ